MCACVRVCVCVCVRVRVPTNLGVLSLESLDGRGWGREIEGGGRGKGSVHPQAG